MLKVVHTGHIRERAGVCKPVTRFVSRHRVSQLALALTAPFLALSGLTADARPMRPISARVQTEAQRTPTPLLLLVSIKKQRLRVLDIGGEIASSRISSGQPGFDTPTGVFSILEKNEYHESNIYEGAPMPHMQRLTWSGIALHAGVVPGYRASHGCIRLPAAFAKSLFGMTKMAGRVVVTNDEVEPIPFEHPKLFKPLPAETVQTAKHLSPPEPTRVAVNDQGPAAATIGLSEMPLLLGVSPALAEAARDPTAFAPERPRSRAEAERATNEKLMALQSRLRAAEAQAKTASEAAKVAMRDGDAAAAKIQSANAQMQPLRAAVLSAEKKMQQAIRTFTDYMAAASVPGKSVLKPAETADDREADLEDAILDATLEADAARAAVAKNELEFAADQAVASAAEATRAAALESVRQTQAQLRFAQNDLIDANKVVARSAKQISVFISLKTERIYIRQGFEPLLEAPITIADDVRRIGTHVLTAMRYGTNPDVFDWRLVSAHLPANAGKIDDDSGGKKRPDPSAPLSAEASVRMARAALDAITIPPDILTTISELARPGASLIISDRDLPANENGLGTEFVVLTR